MTKLTCKSCGAKLELTDDIDRFSCSNCGTEWIVNRGGGIVSLKGVEDGLNKVVETLKESQTAEAIEREEELRSQARQKIEQKQMTPASAAASIGSFFLFLGFCTLYGAYSTAFTMHGTAAEEISNQVTNNSATWGWVEAGLGVLFIFAASKTGAKKEAVQGKKELSTSDKIATVILYVFGTIFAFGAVWLFFPKWFFGSILVAIILVGGFYAFKMVGPQKPRVPRIIFKCKSCNSDLSVENIYVGRIIDCPGCKIKNVVPEKSGL